MKRFLFVITLMFMAPQIADAVPDDFRPGDADEPYDFKPGDADKPHDFKPGDADKPYDFKPASK
jgi:hypothetical protein